MFLPVNAFPVGIQVGVILKSWELEITGNAIKFYIATKHPNKTMVGHLKTKGFDVIIDPNFPAGKYLPKDYVLGNKIINALLVFGKTKVKDQTFYYNGDSTVHSDGFQTFQDALSRYRLGM